MDAAAQRAIYEQYGLRAGEPMPELWQWLATLFSGVDPQDMQAAIKEAIQAEKRHEREAVERKEAARLLRRFLVKRGFSTSPEQEARIEACTDLATLERWAEQTMTAASVDEALT